MEHRHRCFARTQKQFGFSLVELMIVVGIGSIVAMGFMTMMSSQDRQVRELSEQLASSDLERIMTNSLSSVCSGLFTNPAVSGLVPANAKFNSGAAIPITSAFTITSIPIASFAGAPMAAQQGGLASSMSRTMKIKNITVDITGFNPLTPTQATGAINIAFDPTTSVTSMKPLSFPIQLSLVGAGANTQVTGCSAGVTTNSAYWSFNDVSSGSGGPLIVPYANTATISGVTNAGGGVVKITTAGVYSVNASATVHYPGGIGGGPTFSIYHRPAAGPATAVATNFLSVWTANAACACSIPVSAVIKAGVGDLIYTFYTPGGGATLQTGGYGSFAGAYISP